MPNLPKRYCSHPGCCNLVTSSHWLCLEHWQRCARESHRRADSKRLNANARGYDKKRWRPMRDLHLSRNPLCAQCQRDDKITEAREVDHIIPHKGDLRLLYDATNLQSLCKPCHSRKTAREDGGFGLATKTRMDREIQADG